MTTATLTHPKILVLNKAWQPVALADVERAFGLLVTGAAKAVDKQFQTFDFESWSALSAEVGDDVVHTVRAALKVPRVLVLQVFDRMPRNTVRFSRNNIYVRDGFTCQYCGEKHSRSKLNLDHVVPKSLGGRTNWTNIVCSCVSCNLQKGGRTPEQAGMTLARQPKRPDWASMMPKKKGTTVPYEEWLPFIDMASASYWNTELDAD
jgi:5-methylcytosine-specific restriction endonuclease McrA